MIIPLLEIFRIELRQCLRIKRLIWQTLLLLAPTLIIVLVSLVGEEKPDRTTFIGLGYFLFIQIFTPLISLMYGSNMIAHEVDNKTITYLLIQPVPKWLMLVAKYLANVLATTALLWVTLFISSGTTVILNPTQTWDGLVGISLTFALVVFIGSAIFIALFNLISLITPKPLLFGLAYCLLIEWLLSNLPMLLQHLSISYYLRHLLLANSLIKDFFTSQISVAWLGQIMSWGNALLTLAIILGIGLGLSVFIFRSREFILAEE